MRSKAKTQQRWREAILAQRKSGLSVKDFCEQRRLNGPSFYVWRKQLGMGSKTKVISKPEGFTRLIPPVPILANAIAIVSQRESSHIHIETPNGYIVQAGPVGEEGLKSVLKVLQCI